MFGFVRALQCVVLCTPLVLCTPPPGVHTARLFGLIVVWGPGLLRTYDVFSTAVSQRIFLWHSMCRGGAAVLWVPIAGISFFISFYGIRGALLFFVGPSWF